MTVSKIMEFINTIILSTINEYKLTDESTDESGNYIQHPLETKTDEDKLESLYFGLRDACLNSTPISLIETDGSTATEFRKITSTKYIRVPNEPTLDGNLDIDEGLSFAVMYKALYFLWSGYSNYETEANTVYANFNDGARDYLLDIEDTKTVSETIYFRYSTDGDAFHDTFQDGDIYISFKQGDGVWSNAIKFVGSGGEDGDAGSGSSTFLDLTDTPDTFTANKFLAVNDAGDAIIQVDAPSGAEAHPFDGISGVSGNIAQNFNDIVGRFFYVEVGGDLSFDITKDADGYYELEIGKLYTIEFIPAGYSVDLAFDALGDKTIDSSQSVVMVDILYDSIDVYIMAIRNFA